MLKIKRILSKKGFTLVELMVAVAILGIAAIGIFQSYQIGFWGMSDARARTIATNIAQEKLEEVKGKSLDTGTFPDPDNPIVISRKEFNATIIIDEVESTLKKITTTVSWQKRNGEQTKISIESLLNIPPVFPADDVATSILINANPPSITVEGTTQIKVTILDQDNYPISYNGQVDLLFIPDTPVLGTLANNPLIFNGESYLFTTFTATDAGELDIKAESEGLISDSDTITITGGAPSKINLVVDPSSILIGGDTSTLTIRIEDNNGYLADSWTGTVTLSILPASTTSGTFASTTLSFNGENVKTTLFTSSGTAGTVEIKAKAVGDPSLSPDSDNEIITVSSGPPTKIDIEANPKNIFVSNYTGDGDISSTITVRIKNATDIPTGWTGTVNFTILSGSESGSLTSYTLDFSGESELSTIEIPLIIFNSSTETGVVEIKAEDNAGVLTSDTDTITVAAGPPTKIKLNAVPNIILNNGTDTAVITVITEDSLGNRSGVEVNTTITLTATAVDEPFGNVGNIGDAGTGSSKELSFGAGESLKITTFTCDFTYEGVITITASGDGLSGDSVNITVAPVIIRPAENPEIHYGYHYFFWWKIIDENIIYFNIEVLGGEIEIDKIQVSWTPNNNERLTGLSISNSDGDTIINGTWSGRLSVVEILKSAFGTYDDLVEGIYTIRLLFNNNIEQKSISIKFFTNFEEYQLDFLSPDQIV